MLLVHWVFDIIIFIHQHITYCNEEDHNDKTLPKESIYCLSILNFFGWAFLIGLVICILIFDDELTQTSFIRTINCPA